MSIVILQAGDPPDEVAARRGDFARWIRETVGAEWRGEWRVHDVRTDAPLPDALTASAFVITGSASSVTERAPWMLRAEELVRALVGAKKPLLGICFGHQLVAQALGGRVEKNARGREIGTVRARLVSADPIFDGAPDEFDVSSSHSDVVAALPPGARVLATTDKDDAAALAIGDTTRTVQFHPEFDGDIVRGYVRARAAIIASEGLDPDALVSSAKDAPFGARVLPSFVRRFVR